MKAAVTGATGFVGGALVDLLLENGFTVRVLARDTARAPRRDDVEIVAGDLENAAAMETLAGGADVFFHLAGLTFARRDEDYHRINVEGAATAAAAAANAGAMFVHASSLSAREPHVSPYATSKRDSEDAVADASGDNPWLALRLPAIYGPGDHATLPYFKLIKAGVALEPRTTPPARASILYVRDAARALLAAGDTTLAGAVYEVNDETENGRAWREIGACLAMAMNKKARPVAAPRALVAMFHNISRRAALLIGRTPDVRAGQVNEFFHPDWVARERLFSEASAWRPETPLAEGFAKTVRWYQERGLL